MKDVVTPETARRLKDAGFLQPEFALGQVWYKKDNDTPFVFTQMTTFGRSWFQSEEQQELIPEMLYGTMVYAPTVAEMLKETGGSIGVLIDGGLYHKLGFGQIGYGENLAELLAAGWLGKYAPEQ